MHSFIWRLIAFDMRFLFVFRPSLSLPCTGRRRLSTFCCSCNWCCPRPLVCAMRWRSNCCCVIQSYGIFDFSTGKVAIVFVLSCNHHRRDLQMKLPRSWKMETQASHSRFWRTARLFEEGETHDYTARPQADRMVMFSHDEYVNCNVLIGWFCCHYVEHCRDLYPNAIWKQCPRSAHRYFLRDAFWCTMIIYDLSSCFILFSSWDVVYHPPSNVDVGFWNVQTRWRWQEIVTEAGREVGELQGRMVHHGVVAVCFCRYYMYIGRVSVRTMLEKCHTDLVLCCAISLFEDFIRMFLQCFLECGA